MVISTWLISPASRLADDGPAWQHGARLLDGRSVRRREIVDSSGEGTHSNLHRPRRRHHALALDPGWAVPWRASSADLLRDAGRHAHHLPGEIRRRGH